jgi:hypothetical protein
MPAAAEEEEWAVTCVFTQTPPPVDAETEGSEGF